MRRWIHGTAPEADTALDRITFARDVGAFLNELHSVPPGGGPLAGRHTWFRGCHPVAYSGEVHHCLDVLRDCVDTAACRRIWSDASSTSWSSAPVWFHGDLTTGNLLVSEGRLVAVIDFGVCGVGDPACDLALAWTYFRGKDREAFMTAASPDSTVWLRARAWALWKALITIAGQDPTPIREAQHLTLTEVLADR